MKKFSSSASLANNNTNCNSNSKITNKLIANQITNDIIKPKAISAAEAKLKNANNINKNYAKTSNELNKCGAQYTNNNHNDNTNSNGGSSSYRQKIDCATIEANDYPMHIGRPSTSIEMLSCASTNSSDTSSNSNVCVDYMANEMSEFRKNSIVNEYTTSNYLLHRPKSSQSQHNPHKSPAEKKNRKSYSPQHTTSSMYAKKHQHNKKSNHHHTHKQLIPIPITETPNAQYTTQNMHTKDYSTAPSPPVRPRLPEHSNKKR